MLPTVPVYKEIKFCYFNFLTVILKKSRTKGKNGSGAKLTKFEKKEELLPYKIFEVTGIFTFQSKRMDTSW